MTQQEFVKKYAKAHEESKGGYMCREAFGDGYGSGLTKGLEIAKEFADYLLSEFEKTLKHKESVFDDTQHSSELLTIFLTEKYGK